MWYHSCQRVEVHLEQLNLNDRLFGSRRKLAMKMTMYRKRISRASLVVLTASLLSACSLLTERPYPISDHSDGSRFYNRDGSDKGLSDISQFLWQSLWSESAWPESLPNPVPSVIPDRVKDGIRATYINHATILIQVDGMNILTDPIWSERASPVTFAGPKRIRAPGIKISDLPEIDLVLISHNHYDHLDTATLRQLRQQQKKNPSTYQALAMRHYSAHSATAKQSNSTGITIPPSRMPPYILLSASTAQREASLIKCEPCGGPLSLRQARGISILPGTRAIHHTSRSKGNFLAPSRLAFYRSARTSLAGL